MKHTPLAKFLDKHKPKVWKRLADHMKVTASAVTRMKNGTTKQPEAIHLKRMAEYFQEQGVRITYYELLKLVGRHAEASEEEASMRRNKIALVSDTKTPYDITRVPLIAAVSAGAFDLKYAHIDQGLEPGAGFDYVVVPGNKISPNDYGIVIRGDSLEPAFHDGTKIIVAPEEPFRPGHLHVVKAKDERGWIKFVRRQESIFILNPLNPGAEAIILDEKEIEFIHLVRCALFI